MSTFIDRLRTSREKLGLTQDALAKLVHRKKSQSIISNLESGANKSSTYLPEIAHALGVDAYWLKTGLGDSQPASVSTTLVEPTRLAVKEPDAHYVADADHPVVVEIAALARSLDDIGKGMLLHEARAIARERSPSQQREAG